MTTIAINITDLKETPKAMVVSFTLVGIFTSEGSIIKIGDTVSITTANDGTGSIQLSAGDYIVQAGSKRWGIAVSGTGTANLIDLVNLAPYSTSYILDKLAFFDSLADFPTVGNIDKIYIAKDIKTLYLWSGSAYISTAGGGVPYTGATQDLNLGGFSFIVDDGVGNSATLDSGGLAVTSSNTQITASSVGITAQDTTTNKYTATKTDGLELSNGTNISQIQVGTLTEDRVLTLPNKNGILAVTSDIPANSDGITQGSTNLFLTSSERAKLTNTNGSNTGDETTASIKSKLGISILSGANTGDETTATIQSKLGTASTSTGGYLTSADWNTFNNKQANLGFTPENVINKSTNTSLGTSDTLYPSQNAVKTYADLKAPLASPTFTGTTTLANLISYNNGATNPTLSNAINGTGSLLIGAGGANGQNIIIQPRSNNTGDNSLLLSSNYVRLRNTADNAFAAVHGNNFKFSAATDNGIGNGFNWDFTTSSGGFNLLPRDASSTVPILKVKAFTGHTASMQEWQTATGVAKASITKDFELQTVTGAGAPTSTPVDGAMYVDTTNARLYIRSGGAWKYAVLV